MMNQENKIQSRIEDLEKEIADLKEVQKRISENSEFPFSGCPCYWVDFEMDEVVKDIYFDNLYFNNLKKYGLLTQTYVEAEKILLRRQLEVEVMEWIKKNDPNYAVRISFSQQNPLTERLSIDMSTTFFEHFGGRLKVLFEW